MAGSGQGRGTVDGRQHGRIVSQGVVVFLGWQVWWWVAGSRLTGGVAYLLCGYALRFVRTGFCGGGACRADVACWGGWGLMLPRSPNRPHPPQPTPPSRHGPLRCVWVRNRKYRVLLLGCIVCRFCAHAQGCLSFPFHVTPHSGAGAHGIARQG